MATVGTTMRTGAARVAPVRGGLVARVVSGMAGSLFLILASTLPLWQATLKAPQYPDGLRMIAYGSKVTGDVREINLLNHYIGMKPLQWNEIIERILWIPSLVLAAVAIVVALMAGRRWIRRTALAGLWLFPVGVLADIQFRLFQYGHDLEPGAALQVPEFTVWAIGPTKVWNFTTWSMPGLGLAALFAAAAAVTFGPTASVRVGELGRGIRDALLGSATTVLLVALLAAPAMAQEHQKDGTPATGGDLQRILDSATPGATVSLEEGVYHGSFIIEQPVTILGGGATLHGDGSGTVLTVDSDDVSISGLSITGSARGPVGSPAGLEVRGDRVTVKDVSIADSYLGIAVYDSKDIRIERAWVQGRAQTGLGDTEHAMSEHGGNGRDDMTEGRGDGIALINSKRVVVRDSKIIDARDGFYLSFASAVMLDGNEVFSGRYGIHSMYATDLTISTNEVQRNVAGVVLMYGGDVLVFGNGISDNTSASTGFGLLVKDIERVEAAKNVITGNRVGIHVEGSAGPGSDMNRFVLNTVALNGTGAAIFPSAVATFSGNSFVENSLQVMTVGAKSVDQVRWTERGAGNYWSDYRGFDRSDDGVGDSAYRTSGVSAELLAADPSLHGLLGSPALTLTLASQERWTPMAVGIVDDLPLMQPHSPGLGAGDRGAPRWALYLSTALSVGGLILLQWGRRRTVPAVTRIGRRLSRETA